MIAENLTTYVSATTPPLSILLGNYVILSMLIIMYFLCGVASACDGLYQEAVQFVEKSNSQSKRLEVQLNQSQSEDIIEMGKVAAVKHVLQRIQAEIEVVYLTIKKRQKLLKNQLVSRDFLRGGANPEIVSMKQGVWGGAAAPQKL